MNHSEQEIAGYRDALAEVHTGYQDMDFRQADILRLHAIMMNIAGYTFAGKYKDFKMSEYQPGVTAPPFHVNCRSTTGSQP